MQWTVEISNRVSKNISSHSQLITRFRATKESIKNMIISRATHLGLLFKTRPNKWHIMTIITKFTGNNNFNRWDRDPRVQVINSWSILKTQNLYLRKYFRPVPACLTRRRDRASSHLFNNLGSKIMCIRVWITTICQRNTN